LRAEPPAQSIPPRAFGAAAAGYLLNFYNAS